MIQGRSRFRFLDKPIQFIGIFTEFFVQKSDSDFSIKFGILGKKNLAHSANDG